MQGGWATDRVNIRGASRRGRRWAWLGALLWGLCAPAGAWAREEAEGPARSYTLKTATARLPWAVPLRVGQRFTLTMPAAVRMVVPSVDGALVAHVRENVVVVSVPAQGAAQLAAEPAHLVVLAEPDLALTVPFHLAAEGGAAPDFLQVQRPAPAADGGARAWVAEHLDGRAADALGPLAGPYAAQILAEGLAEQPLALRDTRTRRSQQGFIYLSREVVVQVGPWLFTRLSLRNHSQPAFVAHTLQVRVEGAALTPAQVRASALGQRVMAGAEPVYVGLAVAAQAVHEREAAVEICEAGERPRCVAVPLL